MIWRSICLIIIFFFFNAINAQTYPLSSHLKEISGLEFINDSILVAHNDSGNSPHLFLISHKGNVIKKILVSNATNIDWEDVASDDEFLYIGDIGNNMNKRKDLKIYRIKITDLLIADSVIASPMHIAYADQKAYPPNKNERNFDSECLISAYGDLWIFTKNHSEPFDGYSKVYRFKFQSESYLEIPIFTSINMGTDGYYFDTPTAGDFQNDKFYLNTYNRYLIFELKENEFKLVKKKNFNDYNQKEALTIHNSSIWVANEFNKVFGRQKLKRINLK
jgi:hypothetical protein